MLCKTVLVVDDDEDIRMNLTMALEAEGYEVFTACNGLEALAWLETAPEAERLCCILLDLMMPRMDGEQFLRVLNERHPGRLSSIPVIIATARGGVLDTAGFPGKIETIRKPMDLDELYSAVARHC